MEIDVNTQQQHLHQVKMDEQQQQQQQQYIYANPYVVDPYALAANGAVLLAPPPNESIVRFELLKTLEYYFSAKNLNKDGYLISQMDHEAYVPVDEIAKFPRITQLTNDLDIIKEVIRQSSQLELDPHTETKVRSVNGKLGGLITITNTSAKSALKQSLVIVEQQVAPPQLVQPVIDPVQQRESPVSVQQRSVLILREVSPDATQDKIVELFANREPTCPPCEKVESAGNELWYVTFANEEQAQRALLYLKGELQTFMDRPIKARIKSHVIPRSNTSLNPKQPPPQPQSITPTSTPPPVQSPMLFQATPPPQQHVPSPQYALLNPAAQGNHHPSYVIQNAPPPPPPDYGQGFDPAGPSPYWQPGGRANQIYYITNANAPIYTANLTSPMNSQKPNAAEYIVASPSPNPNGNGNGGEQYRYGSADDSLNNSSSSGKQESPNVNKIGASFQPMQVPFQVSFLNAQNYNYNPAAAAKAYYQTLMGANQSPAQQQQRVSDLASPSLTQINPAGLSISINQANHHHHQGPGSVEQFTVQQPGGPFIIQANPAQQQPPPSNAIHTIGAPPPQPAYFGHQFPQQPLPPGHNVYYDIIQQQQQQQPADVNNQNVYSNGNGNGSSTSSTTTTTTTPATSTTNSSNNTNNNPNVKEAKAMPTLQLPILAAAAANPNLMPHATLQIGTTGGGGGGGGQQHQMTVQHQHQHQHQHQPQPQSTILFFNSIQPGHQHATHNIIINPMMSGPPPQQQPSSSSPKLNIGGGGGSGQYTGSPANQAYYQHRTGPKNDQAKSPGNQAPYLPNNNNNNPNNKYASNGKAGKYQKQVGGAYPTAPVAAASNNNKNLFAYYQSNMGANVLSPHQLAALNQIYPAGVFNPAPPPPQHHPHHVHPHQTYVQPHHPHHHMHQQQQQQQQPPQHGHLNNSNYDSNSSSGISTSSALSSTSHTPIRSNPKENGAAESPVVPDAHGLDVATGDVDHSGPDLPGPAAAETNNIPVPVKKGEQLQVAAAALDPAIISISKSADSIPSSPTIIKSNMIIDSSSEQSKMATFETLANILTAPNPQESSKTPEIVTKPMVTNERLPPNQQQQHQHHHHQPHHHHHHQSPYMQQQQQQQHQHQGPNSSQNHHRNSNRLNNNNNPNANKPSNYNSYANNSRKSYDPTSKGHSNGEPSNYRQNRNPNSRKPPPNHQIDNEPTVHEPVKSNKAHVSVSSIEAAAVAAAASAAAAALAAATTDATASSNPSSTVSTPSSCHNDDELLQSLNNCWNKRLTFAEIVQKTNTSSSSSPTHTVANKSPTNDMDPSCEQPTNGDAPSDTRLTPATSANNISACITE